MTSQTSARCLILKRPFQGTVAVKCQTEQQIAIGKNYDKKQRKKKKRTCNYVWNKTRNSTFTQRNLKKKRKSCNTKPLFQLNVFNFMEIQQNSKSFQGTLLYMLYSFLFFYFKTWSLVQQYHKQSLMSQMEPLMTINYTCHAIVLR